MPVFTIETPDGKVFDIEGDVAPTEEQIQQIISQQDGEPVAPYTDITAEINRAQQARQDEERNRREGWGGDLDAFLGSMASTATWGVGDLAYRGLYGADAAEEQRQIRKANPIYSAAGAIAGFIPGLVGGPVSWAASGATKAATSFVARKTGEAGLKKIAQAASGKFATSATQIAAESAIGAGQFQIQQTAEKLAGTRDFEEGSSFLGDTAFAAAASVAFRGAGAATNAVRSVLSKEYKAVQVMGGAANVKRAQKDYVRALESGRSAEEAEGIFQASLMQGIGERDRAVYEHLVQKNPDFAKFARSQMAGGGEVVVETASALTAQQYKKYSKDLLDNLYGPEYRNALGTTEIDFSKAGLKDLLGTSNTGAAMEARKKALVRAEENVMSNPSLAKQVSDDFRIASDNLMSSGSRDFQRAANMIEPASIKSYVGSDAYQEAIQVADDAVNAMAEQLAENGQQITQAQMKDISMQAHRAGAQKHFKKIMAEGTDSVQDINDIKEFFKAVDENAVAAGQAEAFGAFNESINKQILDKLDPVLYESNQALRYEKTLTDMHDFGKKFEQTKINELQSKLNNGLSAEEKGMKVAAFKMGVLENLNDAVISGNREKVEQLQAMFRSKRSLGQFFEPEEISRYMEAIRPKAEAAHNIERILLASGKFAGNQDMIAPVARIAVGTMTGSRNTYANAAITLMQKARFGKGTAKAIERFSQDPTSRNLNRLIKSTTDLTERQQLNRILADAVDSVTDSQAIIRGMQEGMSDR